MILTTIYLTGVVLTFLCAYGFSDWKMPFTELLGGGLLWPICVPLVVACRLIDNRSK